jgi:hypothetical protein
MKKSAEIPKPELTPQPKTVEPAADVGWDIIAERLNKRSEILDGMSNGLVKLTGAK